MKTARLTYPQLQVMLDQLRAAEAFAITIDDVAGTISARKIGGPVVLRATRGSPRIIWEVHYHAKLWE